MNKELSSLEALFYLDDIAHGRKMKYDAHELKLLIESDLKNYKYWRDFYRLEYKSLLIKNQRLIEIIKSNKKLYKQYKNELGL